MIVVLILLLWRCDVVVALLGCLGWLGYWFGLVVLLVRRCCAFVGCGAWIVACIVNSVVFILIFICLFC